MRKAGQCVKISLTQKVPKCFLNKELVMSSGIMNMHGIKNSIEKRSNAFKILI